MGSNIISEIIVLIFIKKIQIRDFHFQIKFYFPVILINIYGIYCIGNRPFFLQQNNKGRGKEG